MPSPTPLIRLMMTHTGMGVWTLKTVCWCGQYARSLLSLGVMHTLAANPTVTSTHPDQIAQRYTPNFVIIAPVTIAAGATVKVLGKRSIADLIGVSPMTAYARSADVSRVCGMSGLLSLTWKYSGMKYKLHHSSKPCRKSPR